MNFNQAGTLLRSDRQIVKSGITKGLKSNIVFQEMKRKAFECERECYILYSNQYDRR